MKEFTPERTRCSVCGRQFSIPFRMSCTGNSVCPECNVPRTADGYQPMVQIEVGEHQRLLQLYYAEYNHQHHPTQHSGHAVMRAIQRLNSYYGQGRKA